MSKGIKSKHDKAKPNTHHATLCSDHAAYYRVSLSLPTRSADDISLPCHRCAKPQQQVDGLMDHGRTELVPLIGGSESAFISCDYLQLIMCTSYDETLI